jgi:S-adenosylmethionine decarboxylase
MAPGALYRNAVATRELAISSAATPSAAGMPQDLAPSIYRQRLVVEGHPARSITAEEISEYLSELSVVCGMTQLIEPVTHRSDQYGWAGWVHWETSGAHFYAWEQPSLFFSVDVYACAPFSPEAVVAFTKEFFDAATIVATAL